MRICFVADARSPIAKNWITYFVQRGYDVHLISSYPCAGDSYYNASVREVTSGLSRRAGSQFDESGKTRGAHGLLSRITAEARTGRLSKLTFALQHWVERSGVGKRSDAIRDLLQQIKPDVIHAMRLPFEGITAALADPQAPLLISIWGNDFTLFAHRFPLTAGLSRVALQRADALHCDCSRDLKLAVEFGFNSHRPSIVLPGGGGIQIEVFGAQQVDFKARGRFNIPEDAPLVCNPRGFRHYVRNDTFFRSAALASKRRPDIIFAAVAMRGHPVAERWITALGIRKNVRLLPTLSRAEMAMLLRTSDVVVSAAEHDGTPNSLLESMAAGAFPVVGDIESVREWITDGVNGSLRSPTDPSQFSEAILSAISNSALRQSAAVINRRLIDERAEYTSCMKKAEDFYHQLIRKPQMKVASV
jgi:glycosyltransferase involved in cell wall biosynthesis